VTEALFLVGCSGGSRCSQLVALDVADIIETADGLKLTLRRSKTDQEAAVAIVAVPYGSHPQTCPLRSLRAWLTLSGDLRGPRCGARSTATATLGAGRLQKDSVARIIKRACAPAGLDPACCSGHSLRSGMATSAAAGGAPERAIMRQGRWSSQVMVDRYVRHGTI
jgi:integrase